MCGKFEKGLETRTVLYGPDEKKRDPEKSFLRREVNQRLNWQACPVSLWEEVAKLYFLT